MSRMFWKSISLEDGVQIQVFYVFGNMRIKFRYNIRDEEKNQRLFS